jgi:hypothetical protein
MPVPSLIFLRCSGVRTIFTIVVFDCSIKRTLQF